MCSIAYDVHRIEDPEEPMDYTPVEPIEIPEEQDSVEVEDICEFFVGSCVFALEYSLQQTRITFIQNL